MPDILIKNVDETGSFFAYTTHPGTTPNPGIPVLPNIADINTNMPDHCNSSTGNGPITLSLDLFCYTASRVNPKNKTKLNDFSRAKHPFTVRQYQAPYPVITPPSDVNNYPFSPTTANSLSGPP
ncbi:MAG: hypothetical protein CMM58_06760 [Rhodospirillaceae bacterium]|nr:hypothetical protein [Rhodospirillaceae bacterium]